LTGKGTIVVVVAIRPCRPASFRSSCSDSDGITIIISASESVSQEAVTCHGEHKPQGNNRQASLPRSSTRTLRLPTLTLAPVPKAENLPFLWQFVSASCACVSVFSCSPARGSESTRRLSPLLESRGRPGLGPWRPTRRATANRHAPQRPLCIHVARLCIHSCRDCRRAAFQVSKTWRPTRRVTAGRTVNVRPLGCSCCTGQQALHQVTAKPFKACCAAELPNQTCI
jgi:hypothetical protein